MSQRKPTEDPGCQAPDFSWPNGQMSFLRIHGPKAGKQAALGVSKGSTPGNQKHTNFSSFAFLGRGVWVKIEPPGYGPQVLVAVSTYQGKPFWGHPIFLPQPGGGGGLEVSTAGAFIRPATARRFVSSPCGTGTTSSAGPGARFFFFSGRSGRVRRGGCRGRGSKMG